MSLAVTHIRVTETGAAKTVPPIVPATPGLVLCSGHTSDKKLFDRGHMLLGEIVPADAKFFLKSEWGPISTDWPALSFTQAKVGRRLRAELNPPRDVVIYVGTGNPASTQDERHRRRLLSVLRVEPNQIYATEDLVPRDSWLESREKYPGRFVYSFPVLQAWEFDTFPLASDLVPNAYSSLGDIQFRGDVVEVSESEKSALRAAPVHELDLELQAIIEKIRALGSIRDLQRDENQAILRMERFVSDPEDPINGEIARMVALIDGRVSRGGTQSTHTNPFRYAPPTNTPLVLLLTKKWFAQNKRCALCMGRIVPQASNALLQPSPDRVDSSNPCYDENNLVITHLGCNLAKNKFSVSEFEGWMAVIRAVD